jgi:hypothetical protein
MTNHDRENAVELPVKTVSIIQTEAGCSICTAAELSFLLSLSASAKLTFITGDEPNVFSELDLAARLTCKHGSAMQG